MNKTYQDSELNLLREEMRAAVHVLREHAETIELTNPSTFNMDDLRQHFHGLGDAVIMQLLRTHCGYVGRKGRPVVIHRDQVRKLDQILAEKGAIERAQQEAAQ